MIYLDTHVVVWLYAGLTKKFSKSSQQLINEHDLKISPIVRLELQYLFEIKRISDGPKTILDDLSERIGMSQCTKPFEQVISKALTIDWTRDPFDRIIVAQASIDGNYLISSDETIHANYELTQW